MDCNKLKKPVGLLVLIASGLTFASPGNAQFPSFKGPSGGKPAPPFNSVQYNNAGTFGGTANYLWINTPLSTPTDPVVTVVGTPGMTSYGYRVVARNLVGYTPRTNRVDISTGNAVLDGTNKNSIATVALTGSTSCDVFRAAGPGATGYIGSVACGATLLDTGQAVGAPFSSPFGNTSRGLYVGNTFSQADLGDTNHAFYSGTAFEGFPAFMQEILTNSKNAFAHLGTADNIADGVVTVALDSTDGGEDAFAVMSYANACCPFGITVNHGPDSNADVGLSVGLLSRFHPLTSGGDASTSVDNFLSRVTLSGATITGDVRHFHAEDSNLLDTGNLNGSTIGLLGDDFTSGSGSKYTVYSAMNAATNKWGFYGAGTAAIKPGTTVFASLVAYANGAEVFCSDCTVTSGIDNTCSGTGSGALAERVNGVWKCTI